MNHMQDMGISPNIYIMMCGRTTPEQRNIIRNRAQLDRDLYMDILNYFITKSGHSGYEKMSTPSEFPSPVFVEDTESENNTDESVDPTVENSFQGGTYNFSTAQDPSDQTSVYSQSQKFAWAMLNQSTPTLLVAGGNYANMKELRIEDVLPFAFPFGLGGLKGPRRTRISQEALFQRYFRLAMPQFMRGDVIAVLAHMYGRLLSFKSGVMTCRSIINGKSIGETLADFTKEDFANEDSSNPAMNVLLKSINTSCRALAHTPEAAKQARKRYFSFMDHFGLNSVFASLTPDDLCSFRVRLYAYPGVFVSFVIIVNHDS